jgi:hypothetical protein
MVAAWPGSGYLVVFALYTDWKLKEGCAYFIRFLW